MKCCHGPGITCCENCVPPKRHANCHSTCEEYLKEKKAHDELQQKIYKKRFQVNDFRNFRYKNLTSARKNKNT